MRLRRLWLRDYGNLKDVTISFDESPSIYEKVSLRFFVGLNGSGKSTALEALGMIFSHLAAGESPGFEFDVEYELSGRIVRLTTIRQVDHFRAKPLTDLGLALLIRPFEEMQWMPEHVQTSWPSSGDGVLPGKVVGYSTGPTSEMHQALSRSIERLVRSRYRLTSGPEKPAVMSEEGWDNFRVRMQEGRDTLDEYLENPDTLFLGAQEGLCAVLPLLLYTGERVGYESRYWGNRRELVGRVGLAITEPLAAFTLRVAGDWAQRLTRTRRDSLRRLLERATVHSSIEADESASGRYGFGSEPDFYAVYDVDRLFRRETMSALPSRPLGLFEELLAWMRRGAVQEIRLVVRRKYSRRALPDTALSDGEFLLLGRYALLLMLSQMPDEVLILFDEPETHYNDEWKVRLVGDICKFLRRPAGPTSSPTHSEVLIATHSAITLSDADARQVLFFRRENGSVKVGPPTIRTFASDIESVSRLFFGEEQFPIGRFAEQIVHEHITKAEKRGDLEPLLQLVGPGFLKLQLIEALRRLPPDDRLP